MSGPGSAAPALVLDGGDRRTEHLGGKGASLDQLVAWGFRIPATGVVTASAYRTLASVPSVARLLDSIRAGTHVSAEQVDAVFAAARLPDEIVSDVVDMCAEIGGGSLLAIRSSATVEDLADSSFAGQYRSILGVDPADEAALMAAVRAVFASLWHPSPCAYRAALGVDDTDISMAVVVMRMVSAARAGVVFTTDPATPGSARIEVIDGLGEDLVSGERTPEAYVVAHDEDDTSLPVEVRAALDASLRIEELSGLPHDVEWAWDGERLWVVQARPITVSEPSDPFDSPLSDDDLTTAGIGEMLPGVLPPLRWQLAAHLAEQAFRRLFDDLMPSAVEPASDRPLLRRVQGRAALDFGLMTEITRTFSVDAAGQLESRYFGADAAAEPTVDGGESSERSLRAALGRLRRGRRVAAARRRYVLDADIVVEAVVQVFDAPHDWSTRTDGELMATRAELLDLADRAATAQMGVAAEASSAFDRVVAVLTRYLGEDAAAGHARSVTSALGIRCASSPAASAAVFAGPTWDELGLSPLAPGPRPETAERADLEAALAASDGWAGDGVRVMLRRRALNHAIDDAVAQLRRREETKAALLRVGGAVRAIHLEIADRLVARGLLEQGADVELLSAAEMRHALFGDLPTTGDMRRRRRWLERALARPPLPVRFSGEPGLVDVVTGGDRVDGWAASPGTYRGNAVALSDPSAPFADGDVLVAAATDASWAPLFARAGAVVVERGGPLSHASILARELGVPAVVNAAGAMAMLGGRPVVVDGTAGYAMVGAVEEAVS